MGKIYAVKKGRKTGKFYNWNDCKEQVHGFSGAVYKSFEIESEADEWLSPKAITIPENALKAYVDGSYDPDQNAYSSGVVFIKNDTVIHTVSQRGDGKYLSMRNVAGEVDAALIALQYALEHNEKDIVIYHDYNGLGLWATGEWRAEKEGSIRYKQACEYYKKQGINFHFVKVAAHTGVKYNEMVDQLAKQALGLVPAPVLTSEPEPQKLKTVVEFVYDIDDIKEKPKSSMVELEGTGVFDKNGHLMKMCDPFLCNMYGNRYFGFLDFDDGRQVYFLHFVGKKPAMDSMPEFIYAPYYEKKIDIMLGEKSKAEECYEG